MRKVIALLLLSLAPAAYASGYGWYVKSFDCPQFKTRVKEVEMSGLAGPADVDRVIFEWMGGRSSADLMIVDESPADLEFYWPDALAYAAKLDSGSKPNFFLLFEGGRPYSRAAGKCQGFWKDAWGYCMDAYFVLSPAEVAAFRDQLGKLNRAHQHPEDFRDYLLHLEGVLTKAAAAKRGLYFAGHD
jgi:hypothetical protein